MRIATALIALLLTVTAEAEPQTPRGIVFAYECEQVNQAKVGFSCLFDGRQLTFQFHTKKEDMTTEEEKRFNYELQKLSIRYFELGGTSYTVIADFWERDQRRLCTHSKKRPHYSFGCDDYKAGS